MRNAMSIKMLFRSPLKTFLTFLLVAAASFALFSRVTDYAITMQGIKNIEGFYSCVASLDNEMPDLWYETAVVESRDKLSVGGYGGCQEVPDKPWPSEEKLEEFASLPGVTLADNDRVEELEKLMEDEMNRRIAYAPYATYRIDSGGLENITRIQEILETVFPIAVAAAVLIGVFAPLLVILQSVQEAAFLRILGATKKRVRCILMFEQVILSIAGILLVSGGNRAA